MEEAKKYTVYKICPGCQGDKEIKLNPRRSREAAAREALAGGGSKGRDEGEIVTCSICKGAGKLSTGHWVEIPGV